MPEKSALHSLLLDAAERGVAYREAGVARRVAPSSEAVAAAAAQGAMWAEGLEGTGLGPGDMRAVNAAGVWRPDFTVPGCQPPESPGFGAHPWSCSRRAS